MSILTQHQALELLRYDPQTGFLYRRKSTAPSVKIGDKAGYKRSCDGYIMLSLNGRLYFGNYILDKGNGRR